LNEQKKAFVLDLFFLKVFEANDFDLLRKSITVLTKIDKICHKILLSKSLRDLYLKYLRKYEKQGIAYQDSFLWRYHKFLINFLHNSDKIEEVSEINPKVNATEDDLPVISTACARYYTIIITEDEKHFKKNDEIRSFLDNYKVKVWNLDEAIKNI
jgi:hypothetical protein